MKIKKNKLKSFRVANGLTQKELSKIIGVSQQQLSLYENGFNYPTIEVAKKISDYFKESINEIFF